MTMQEQIDLLRGQMERMEVEVARLERLLFQVPKKTDTTIRSMVSPWAIEGNTQRIPQHKANWDGLEIVTETVYV